MELITNNRSRRWITKAYAAAIAVAAASFAGAMAPPAASAYSELASASTVTATSRSANEICLSGTAIDGTNRYTYCLPYVNGPGTATRVDVLYSSAATALARNRATYAICWSKTDWNWLDRDDRAQGGSGLGNTLGYAYIGSFVLNLSPKVCQRLDRLTYLGKRPTRRNVLRQIAEAVGTLAHETMHASFSVRNEAKAECWAIQTTQFTAASVGVAARYARRLAVAVWRMYPGYKGTVYWSRKCRNGGPWDLNPQIARWP